MELHAIWNRIDQLEQLIMSQAKEIDLLRRVLNTTQVALQNCLVGDVNKSQFNNTNECLMLAPDQQQPSHHRLAMVPANQTHANGLISSSQLLQRTKNQRQQQQQSSNSSATIYKSFLINPFVHPSSAIPPVAQRIVFGAESNAAAAAATQPIGIGTINSSSPSMRQSHLTNGIAANGPLTTRTLPANTRWSTGPSLLGTLAAEVEPDGDDGPAKRSGRFNFFVELLTCFCPCFSMC